MPVVDYTCGMHVAAPFLEGVWIIVRVIPNPRTVMTSTYVPYLCRVYDLHVKHLSWKALCYKLHKQNQTNLRAT